MINQVTKRPRDNEIWTALYGLKEQAGRAHRGAAAPRRPPDRPLLRRLRREPRRAHEAQVAPRTHQRRGLPPRPALPGRAGRTLQRGDALDKPRGLPPAEGLRPLRGHRLVVWQQYARLPLLRRDRAAETRHPLRHVLRRLPARRPAGPRPVVHRPHQRPAEAIPRREALFLAAGPLPAAVV